MTKKIYLIFEYAYVAMFIIAVYMVVTNWEANRDQAYFFGFFGLVAVFMFFFKRRFRKNLEKQKQE